MTKRLILIRHAKSSWDQPGPDHNRPLNKRGYASTKAIGAWLKEYGYWPQEVLCSTAKRTAETCEHLGFEGLVSFTGKLYHASPEPMVDVLKTASADHVAMIGHNPGIAIMASQLVAQPPAHPRFLHYPTCATTVIDFKIDTWDDVTMRNGLVRDFIVPRDLI